MQRWTRMSIVAGMAVLVGSMAVAPVMAQPGGGRGQGGPGGRGGFGGGFGGGNNIFSVVRAESVQKELNITDEQKTKLTALGEEVQTELRGLMPQRGEGGGNQGDMAARFAEVREKSAKLVESKKPALAAILSAEQVKRLDEIVLQSKGVAALSEADVAAKLALTDDQKSKLETINKEYAEKTRELGGFGGRGQGGQGGFDREAFAANREKRETLTKERDAALLAVLTPIQAEQFDALKGKEFDVSTLRPAFGGGRGQGGPGQGGQGRRQRENI